MKEWPRIAETHPAIVKTLKASTGAAILVCLASGVSHLLTSDIAVDFGAAAGAATLSHLALFDAQTSGNLLAGKAMVGGAQAIQVGTGVKFLAGGITFNIGSDT